MKEAQNKDVPIPVRLEAEDSKLLEEIRDTTGISASALIRASVRIFLAYVREHGTIPLNLDKAMNPDVAKGAVKFEMKQGRVLPKDQTVDETAALGRKKVVESIEPEKGK